MTDFQVGNRVSVEVVTAIFEHDWHDLTSYREDS